MNGNYTAVAAKIKAIEAKCLTENDFEELLQKATVNEIYSYLVNNTAYADVLSGLSPSEIHRTEIEKSLCREMMKEFGRIYSFMDISRKCMLEYWFSHYEIEFLKRGLRHLYNKETNDWLEGSTELGEFFAGHTKMNCELIKTAKSIDEFIEACKDTPYGSVLERSKNLESDYFNIASMMDSYYYTRAWKAKDKYLDGEDRKLFADIFGIEIDMENILCIYRSKKYFNIPSERIVGYLIPVRHRLQPDVLKKMVQAQNAQEVIRLTEETPYKNLFGKVDDGFFPEENMNAIYYKSAKSMLSNKPESMAAIYAYFELKEVEISLVTTIIESIRYGLDKQIIRRHIKLSQEG